MAKSKNTNTFKRILMPTDFSRGSVGAADYARSMARQYGASLFVIHVVDTSSDAVGFYLPHLAFNNLEQDMVKKGEELLGRFCSKRLKGVEEVRMRVVAGEPYKQIARFARDKKIDLIVMGTHGKTGMDKLLFGSTTKRVMKKVKCPVLVVPPA